MQATPRVKPRMLGLPESGAQVLSFLLTGEVARQHEFRASGFGCRVGLGV